MVVRRPEVCRPNRYASSREQVAMPHSAKRFSTEVSGRSILMIAVCIFFLAASARAQKPPDTIYYNGVIVTLWPAHPLTEAVAIRGGRFTSVGSDQDVLRTAGPAT